MDNNIQETVPPTVDTSEVSATFPKEITPSIHPAFMFAILIIFWPVAWFLMFHDKYYHRWFAYLLWIFGVAHFCGALYIMFLLLQQLTFLFTELKQSNNVVFTYVGIAVLYMFSLGEIVFGIFIYKKTKQHEEISKKLLFLVMGSLIAGYVVFIFNVMLIIQPIYNLTAAIK